MINPAFNESFTNGYLDFSERDEDDDISMTCELVTELNHMPIIASDAKSVMSCNQKSRHVSVNHPKPMNKSYSNREDLVQLGSRTHVLHPSGPV